MKIQELAIIFVIIILPISLLLSTYAQYQIETINTQTLYDAKLTSATYDAIRAFQLNATNSTTSDLANSKLRDLEASINTFRNSIMSAFEMNGYTKDDLNNYIPALVYTLYDGFYIYSPYENTEEDGKQIYGLKPYISYSCRYVLGNIDVVITYALDNCITVQGMLGDEYVNKKGYLIDGIKVKDGEITYNNITIETEELKEKILDDNYLYAKIDGTKYYLLEDKVVYILNGKIMIQCKKGSEEYNFYEEKIKNNDSAMQYYKEAYEFVQWFKGTELVNLTYKDAVDESGTAIWNEVDTKIFDFNTDISDTADTSNNIENESSNFNQHRLAIIRYKIGTNLAIAIANYNNYSGVLTSNVFQMPELKETEWANITRNISLISFLQGLNIGGKIYNGYSLVTNSESEEVVLEDNIYLLGNDGNYHKIGDKGIEDGLIKISAGDYTNADDDKKYISAGRLNLDFKKSRLINDSLFVYYYPLKDYNASYDSIVMQNNVSTYDDIYEYVNNQNYEFKKAFYTALGRERVGKGK